MNDRELFRNFRVKSARASWHDYGNGIYFVTVCTAHRIHYFGRINNQEMELSALGQFLSYQLEHVSEHYPYARIPFFVVMPDHFHGIVLIDGDLAPSLKRKECVMDDLCDAYEKRQMVKQEMRKQELEEKGENGGLTTREAMELSGYKIQEGLEKMAKLTKPTVCYMA